VWKDAIEDMQTKKDIRSMGGGIEDREDSNSTARGGMITPQPVRVAGK